MASLNKVLLMGNLTRNPEIRYTPGGSAVCEFGMAMNRRFMQANGQEKDETCFVDITVWGKQAESSSRFLQKGSSVFVEGRLVYDQWTEKETGNKRSRLRIYAERVQFLDRRDQTGQPGGEGDGGAPYGQGQPRDSLRADIPVSVRSSPARRLTAVRCRDSVRSTVSRRPLSRRLPKHLRCLRKSLPMNPSKESTTTFHSDSKNCLQPSITGE